MILRKTLLTSFLGAALLFGVSTSATTQQSKSKSGREIAEWVIRQGGRVMLESAREEGKPIGDIARLPAGEIRITGVDLVGTLIEPKELEKISGLTGLKELYLPGPSWNPGAGSRLDANEELKFLAGLKNLEKLHFSLHFLTNVNVQDKGIAHLTGLTQLKEFRCAQCRIAKLNLSPLAKLESLDLSLTPFNDEGMKGLSELRALRRLNLRDTLVTDQGLKYLSGLTQLQELDLSGAKISDAGLAHLRNLTAMRKLNLLGAQITDASADALAGMARLQELNLYRSRITNAGLAKLGNLKELISLDLRYSRVTGAGVDAFRAAAPNCKVNFVNAPATRAKNAATERPAGTGAEAIATWVKALGGKAEISDGKLRTVSLAATGVSDAQLAHLSSFTELEMLDLEATEMGDLGLAAIKGLTGLKRLNLSHTTVSDNGLAHLSGLRNLQELQLAGALTRGPGLAYLKELPALAGLDLSGTPIGAEALRHLAEIPTLERLSLGSTDISNDGLRHLGKLARLLTLDLNSTDIGNEGLQHLGTLTGLKELSLNHTRLTDKGLEHLRPLVNLERLELFRTRTGAAGAAAIASLNNLVRLNLDYTSVDDKALELLKTLPRLRELRLDSTDVTDAGVVSLQTMATLRSLSLYHTLVTEKGYEQLKAELPDCRIVFDRDSSLPNRRKSHRVKERSGSALVISVKATSDNTRSLPLSVLYHWSSFQIPYQSSDHGDYEWITEAGGVVTRDPAGRITGVDLRAGWVTDSDLLRLAALPHLMHLAHLDLSMTRITDHGLQQLKNAPGIVDLNLYYAEQITDEGMEALKNWKRLKRLNLRGTKITDTTLEHLANVTTLESLDAGFAQITDVGLDRLAPLQNLKELVIGGNKLTDVGLQSLRQFPGLTSLSLGGSQRTDSGLWTISLTESGLDAIMTLKSLRELRLDGMPVSSRWLEKLKGLNRLERLSLQGCKRLGDDAAPLLASWPSLLILDLKGTAMTEKGLADLRRAKPNARIFH